jgi:hypothetical protein
LLLGSHHSHEEGEDLLGLHETEELVPSFMSLNVDEQEVPLLVGPSFASELKEMVEIPSRGAFSSSFSTTGVAFFATVTPPSFFHGFLLSRFCSGELLKEILLPLLSFLQVTTLSLVYYYLKIWKDNSGAPLVQ